MFTQKELNLKQRRCLELLKDYDISLHYHPNKCNVVSNSLSSLPMGSLTHVDKDKRELVKYTHCLASLEDHLTDFEDVGVFVYLVS